jgi:hypothetical protein
MVRNREKLVAVVPAVVGAFAMGVTSASLEISQAQRMLLIIILAFACLPSILVALRGRGDE